MESLCLAMPFILLAMVVIICICYRIYTNSGTNDSIEKQFTDNERRIREATNRAADSRKTIGECEALADRSAENQRRIEEKTESATDLAKSARNRAERISDLASECEKILSEAKTKD